MFTDWKGCLALLDQCYLIETQCKLLFNFPVTQFFTTKKVQLKLILIIYCLVQSIQNIMVSNVTNIKILIR